MKNGVIIALFLPADAASALALPDGEAAQDLHITLAILGDVGSIDQREARARIQEWAARTPPITGEVSGLGKFNTDKGDGTQAFYASFDAPSLPMMYDSLIRSLEYYYPTFEMDSLAGVQLDHGFTPHITLAYLPANTPAPIETIERLPITFERVTLAYGEARYEFDLLGRPFIYNGAPVKAVKNDAGEWILDVLGVPFGGPFAGKDSDGEYFDTSTELWLEQIGKRAIVHYHGFTKDGQPADEPEIVGEELSYEVKKDGVWFRVLLNKASETAAGLWEAAKNGLARASSGAIMHLVRPLKQTDRKAQGGHIDLWPLAEISLMDISKGTYPSNSYAVALPALTKRFKAANLKLNLTEDDAAECAETPPDAETPAQAQAEVSQPSKENSEMPEVTMEALEAYLQKRERDAAEKARIEKLEADSKEYEALKAKIAAAEATASDGTQQINRLPNPTPAAAPVQVSVASKWDGFSVGQLGLAYDMLKSTGRIPSAELYRALHAKATKAADQPGYMDNHIVRNSRGEVVREFAPSETAAAVKSLKAVNPMQLADNPAAKANELMYSTQASYGDDWVPAMWSPELWDLVRNGAPVLGRIRQVEVPGESLTIPAMGGRTTVYKVAQSTEQADLSLASGVNAAMTKAATASVTLTPVKGMAWLAWSGELNEDSIIPILPTMQAGLQMDLMEQIDEILISGDTDTANTNISDTGNGSISTAWHLLIANGLRDYALGGSYTVDIGAMDATKFLPVLGKLGTNGAFALDPDKLFWIFDPGMYRTALALGETLTAEKTGSVGTFQSGRLVKIYGSDVVISDRYGKTDANGKIHNTANTNTKGSFLLVRPDRWVVGFGRRITIEAPARDLIQIATDTQHLIASFRLDFKNNGIGAAYGFDVTTVG